MKFDFHSLNKPRRRKTFQQNENIEWSKERKAGISPALSSIQFKVQSSTFKVQGSARDLNFEPCLAASVGALLAA
jgi:hypothetical protein